MRAFARKRVEVAALELSIGHAVRFSGNFGGYGAVCRTTRSVMSGNAAVHGRFDVTSPSRRFSVNEKD